MPKIPGLPERPHYNSVKAYLSELAKDIAGMVVDPVKMERFREQLKVYAKLWHEWKTAEEADQKGFWKPEMGRPECIFNIFSRSYNPLKDIEKEAKRLAGSYALCALIYDSQLPHLDKIDTDIIPTEAVEETLSAPRHMLEDRIVGNRNSGPDVREIYVIEVFFNRVNVDLRELCKSVENKSKLKSIEQEIQQANKLSDIEFLELTVEKFEERTKKILSKDETWHDLDRSLKGWFDSAIGRLEKLGFKYKAGLLKYFYKNLLHFAEGISIRSFRGFPDPSIVASARKNASELAEKFKALAQGAKISLEDAKAEIPVLSKENEFGTIVELLRKDYWLENEDNLKQEIAKVSQDFINRGLYNSTVCTGKQLQVHFDHLENLFNYIIESLKKDFADIPLSNFKEKLFTIVDEEYKKLIPLAYSHLIQAGLAQKNTLKCIEQQVNKKREKTKQAIETKFAILEKQKTTPEDKRNGKKEYEGRTIRVPKPWYKKIWVKIIGGLGVLVLITTLLLNLKAIKEWFYSPRIETSTPIETQLSLTNENKLSVTLKEICKDIDSRPLLQQEETAKRYIGINIQEEHLKLFDIHEYPEDGTFGLTMILPHESDESYLTGRKIFCTVERDKHPQLNAAKKGLEFYVSGQIKDAGSTYIKLSDVSLKFD